jgi:MFS superfamily sulfate permease-like transporter
MKKRRKKERRRPRAPATGLPSGRNLVRLSDSLFFFSTERLRKKEKRHSKELREKRPNPGSFWFTAVGGIFFSATQELQVASLALE